MLHLIADPDVDPRSTASSCFLYVDDADAVHAQWSAAGVGAEGDVDGTRLVPPVDTPYGMRELAVVDPSGNLLRVGSPVRSASAH